ncbi:traf2 and NCK-interacting protein kinase [Xenopus laevis]|uniref:Traf2 and NCK-interacting protein kinase n=2 Tax=Xenopus laevis TaxID=8355 RepID=A0A8J1L5Z7_XENLA|nr:traf2 and NCK-interacting protein kinase [Xenopus laevis]
MCGSNLLSSLNHVQPVGNATCQELKAEEELEPAITICQETTQKSGNDTCQPELENQQESAEVNEENLRDIDEETTQKSGIDTCQPELENQQENAEVNEENLRDIDEELKPEEELDPAITICQETTQKSGNDTCQPELENQQENAEVNEENLRDIDEELKPEEELEPAITICQETTQESGNNTCQPQLTENEQESAEINNENLRDINEAYQHLLATKYPKPRSYVQVLEPIGEDSYGVIYNGWHRKEQKEVAVTIMKDEEKQKEVLNELQVLETISGHGNIIGYYGAYFQPASVKMPEYEGLWISMERYSGTSVKQLFNSNISHSLKEGWIAYTCKEVLKGLCHLDKHKVIHHDIRPNNIMITSDAEVKISDVSYATIGENSHSTAGALPYMAPEVLANTDYKVIEYTSKADVWSLGISALEMAEGYYPFSRFPSHARIKRIMHGPAPVLLWDSWSDNFHDFIKKCLQKNPDWRPSAEQLLSHPFVCNIWNERGVKSNIKWHLQREMKH